MLHSRLGVRAYALRPLLLEPHERSYRVGETSRVVRQLLVPDPDGYLIRLAHRVK